MKDCEEGLWLHRTRAVSCGVTPVTSHNCHGMNCKYKCSRTKLSKACVAPPASLHGTSSASSCCACAFLSSASPQYLIEELSSQGLLLSYSSKEKLCDKHRIQVSMTKQVPPVLRPVTSTLCVWVSSTARTHHGMVTCFRVPEFQTQEIPVLPFFCCRSEQWRCRWY